MRNIWLKEISLEDDRRYCDLLIELANYDEAYAHPVPKDFSYDDYDFFKAARVRMALGKDLPNNVVPTSTYWVMMDDEPIGYATLKHKADDIKPGGHFGCCLKREYQNQGIGSIVSQELFNIAYYDLGLTEVIFTSKNENIQSQKSVEKIGASLISNHDGYYFYKLDLTKIMNEEKGKGK